jgi:hypothetical protein
MAKNGMIIGLGLLAGVLYLSSKSGAAATGPTASGAGAGGGAQPAGSWAAPAGYSANAMPQNVNSSPFSQAQLSPAAFSQFTGGNFSPTTSA